MMEQRSDEWFTARLGKVTASKVSDVVAKTKSGYGASRETYMTQLVLERITNTQTAFFSNAAMQWGTDQEPLARAAYEAALDVLVDEEGFVPHPTIEMAGASPDGLVDADGLVEIKCPNSATHKKTLLSRKADSQYVNQMMWQMACTGRMWCDFVSYDPRFPEHLQLFVTRVFRDDTLIAQLESEVTTFLAEVNEEIEKLNNLKP